MNNINKSGLVTERNKKILNNNFLLNKNNSNKYIFLKNNEKKYLIKRKSKSKTPNDNLYINNGNYYKTEKNIFCKKPQLYKTSNSSHKNMNIIEKNNKNNTIKNLANYITYKSPLNNYNNINSTTNNKIFYSLINIKKNNNRNISKHYINIKNNKFHKLQRLNDSIIFDNQLKSPLNNISNNVSFKTNNNLSNYNARNDILQDHINKSKTLE
jgi:hypothetical protein